MNFLQFCGRLLPFAGADGDDSEDDARLAGWIPENAELIDPLDFGKFPTLVLEDPPVTVYSGFLSDYEVTHLLSLCEGLWKPSWVRDIDANKTYIESETRSSSSHTLRRGDTQIVGQIERRVSELAGIDGAFLEKLSCVRYLPGEQYKVHHVATHGQSRCSFT